MNFFRSTLLYAAWLWCLPAAAAQLPGTGPDYKVRVISVNDGLPQQAVNSVMQDRHGFLWLGTYDGLCRYDGYGFRTWRHIPSQENSLGNNRILATCEDSRGNIWIGTEGAEALNLYDYDTDRFIHPRQGPWREVRTICEDAAGKLWIGTSTGLFIAEGCPKDSMEARFAPRYTRIDTLREGPIHKIVRDAEGNMWVLGGGGIVCADPSERVIGHYNGGVAAARTICCDSRSAILAVCPGEVWVRERGQSGFRRMFAGGSSLQSIAELPDSTYLIGTESERVFVLARTPGGEFRASYPDFSRNPFFDRNIVKTMLMDRAGCLWIGSGHNGLAMVDMNPKRFNRLELSSAGGHYFARSVLMDSRHRLWIGVKLGGLYRTEGGVCRKLAVDERQSFNAILEDRGGNVWVCTNRNVYIDRGGALVNLRDVPGVPKDVYRQIVNANCIAEDPRGDIWIGGPGKMLRLRGIFTRDFSYRYYTDDFTADLYCIRTDPASGRMWCGSRSRGLWIVSFDAATEVASVAHIGYGRGSLKSDHIWCLEPDSGGAMWVGTDSGLNKVVIGQKDTTIVNLDASPKLEHSKIMAITRDAAGDLWLNTGQGLVHYSPGGNRYREYFYSDGLYSNTMTEAAFLDPHGIIYAGTIDGLNWFDPRQIADDPYTIPPQIVSLKTGNREITASTPGQKILQGNIMDARRIVIHHHDDNFTLGFLSPYYRNQELTRYAYRMEGIDRQWIETDAGQREATYNRLPAGHYTFRVRSANPDGIWSTEERTLEVVVKPAPWNTWWAYTLYVLAVLAIVFTLLRYYYLQYKFKRDAQMEHVQREHERILNDVKLKFHTNISHEIRTSLTLISAPVDEMIATGRQTGDDGARLGIIKRNVDHLSDLVHQLLDMRRIDKEALPLQLQWIDPAGIVADVYSRYRSAAAQKRINFTFTCEGAARGWFDADKIIKITSNLLSNALKFTPEGGYVSLTVDRMGDWLEISVEDSGAGIPRPELDRIFDRYFQGASRSNTGVGIGLSLVHRLVELHRGRISVSSDEGRGSTFSVSLPCSEEAYEGCEMVRREPETEGRAPEEAVTLPQSKPVVMVVEDNPDMLEYLTLGLQEHYTLITDSEVGPALDKALKYIPDLVLLDVMLPGGSGLELCEAIKGNLMTEHIPVVILSAKGDEQDIALGYGKGAEDYLTKPFSKELLLMKIANIIKYRRRPDGEIRAAAGEEQPADTRSEFLQRIEGIIAQHYHRSEFCINDICSELGTSRTQLFRKLRAITDKTVSDLLRDRRMERARELLRDGRYNVSEVMYLVGINSPSYFSRTFREYYGISPSEHKRS